MQKVTIIGAGLAGSEAAWQSAEAGAEVILYEMRPTTMTPAHHTELFAELVCSNSLGANSLENAGGLLKQEMRKLNSLILKAADETKVPAGGALAVDREAFGKYITDKLMDHPKISVINQEVTTIDNQAITIVATGPLTSPNMSTELKNLTGEQYLYFYDAAAPIVTAESLDMSEVFRASRYGKGGTEDYLNCPMNQEEYEHFWQELIQAEKAEIKDFEKALFFEGCMPVEIMAARGIDTLRFGPMKPVGLIDPKTGKEPYAVVQLRQENTAGTLYNMVGFQTHLKWPEQKRVFGLIPGLKNAEFVRLGVMHRNTFINSPRLLKPTFQLKNNSKLLFAGQITGVEGYIESAASGLIAGLNAARLAQEIEPVVFPEMTALGALTHYITTADSKYFQPMNMNFGLMPPLERRIKNKKEKNAMIAARALEVLEDFVLR